MKKAILWMVVVIIVIAGIWYVSKRQPAEKGPIKIGFIGPLTGAGAVYGVGEKNATELAVEEINQQGGVKGRVLQAVYEDGKCDGKEAATAAQKLINIDGVKIILGGLCSAETLGAAPIAETNKVILLSAFSSSPNITEAGDYIFRAVLSDTDPAVIGPIIPYLKQQKSIAIITENSDYSMGVRQALKEQLSNIVDDEVFAPTEKDFKTYLTKIKQKTPEALFINAGTGAEVSGLIVKQAKELGLSAKLYGNFLLVGPESIKIAGNLLEGAIAYDAPLLNEDNSKAKVFMQDYKTKFSEPASFWDAGARYDTVYIVKSALEKCGEDTDCIKNYFYTMDWYDGVVGRFKFDENGDVIGIKCVAKQIIDGEPQVIK